MSNTYSVDPVKKPQQPRNWKRLLLYYLAFSGMGCPKCAIHVRNSLFHVYGIYDVYVDHTIGVGHMVYAPKLTTVSAMVNAIAQGGNDGRHEYRTYLLGQPSNVRQSPGRHLDVSSTAFALVYTRIAAASFA